MLLLFAKLFVFTWLIIVLLLVGPFAFGFALRLAVEASQRTKRWRTRRTHAAYGRLMLGGLARADMTDAQKIDAYLWDLQGRPKAQEKSEPKGSET